MTDPKAARDAMVDEQLARRGIADTRVLDAMRSVPREKFVPRPWRAQAYDDAPLPIEEGQTISQPWIVARMIEAAQVRPADRVLDVGTGSGYAAAVLARLGARVYSIERHPKLAELARTRLASADVDDVELRVGDGSLGWPQAAPFDAILVAATGPSVPEPLREQLAPGGRLVMPVGELNGIQRLLRVIRGDDGSFSEDDLGEVRFVPLIGERGFADRAR